MLDSGSNKHHSSFLLPRVKTEETLIRLTFKMQSLYVLSCLLLAAAGQEFMQPEIYVDSYPEWYMEPQVRHRRDLSVDHKTGDVTLGHKTQNGQAFGTLGSRGEALFGKAGYTHNVFNDGRGKLDATAYGTRVLSPYGGSNHLGGRMDWNNQNAAASLDVSKQMRGPTAIGATAGGRWPVGKNGHFDVGAGYNRFGKVQDYSVRAGYNHRW